MSISPFVILPVQPHPLTKEMQYRDGLLKLSNKVSSLTRVKVNPNINRVNISSLYVVDSQDDLDDILDSIAYDISSKEKELIKQMVLIGGSIRGFVGKNFIKSILASNIDVRLSKSLTVDIFSDKTRSLDKFMNAWISTNTRLITSIPTQQLDNVARVINSGFRNGSSINFIQEQLRNQFKISKNRARLIARDQVSKLASDILRFESLELGADEYIWRTSEDDRVRDSHRALNGKVCSWKDPTIYKDNVTDKIWKKRSSIGGVELNVGQDFQCRCSAKIIFKTAITAK